MLDGPAPLLDTEAWFGRWGSWAVFLGRITPLVRSFISIPAGVFRTPFARYVVLTLLGSMIWCFGFAAAGWALGSGYEQIHHAFGYDDVLAVAAAVLGLVALAVLHRRRRRVRA